MEFTQTKLKLRVAICPFNSFPSEQHHRVVGMKRDASSQISPLIVRQFLLLLPLQCTFFDLKSLSIAQYSKLYGNEVGFVPLQRIIHFRDVNQCDLDDDYQVADICASNDLVYAVVEVEASSVTSKKSKGNLEDLTENSSIKPVEGKPSESQKKVPEFKPTQPQVKAPVNSQPSKQSNFPSAAKPQPPQKLQPTPKPAQNQAVAPPSPVKPVHKAPVPIKIPGAAKPEQTPVITATVVSPVEVKSVTEAPVISSSASLEEFKIKAELVSAPKNEIVEKSKEIKKDVIKEVIKNNEELIKPVTVNTSNFSSLASAPPSIITPSPTPILRDLNSGFQPRKSLTVSLSDTDSDDDDDQSTQMNISPNLFGESSVISTEPRRSDVHVLFAADTSSSEDYENNNNNNNNNGIDYESTLNSIVTLQAVTSSELEDTRNQSSSEEEADQNENENELKLPASVTIRRMSNVNGLKIDPEEMLSLAELKESVRRTPTPIQMVEQTKNTNTNNNNNNNNNNTNNIINKNNGHHNKKKNNNNNNNNNNYKNSANRRGRPKKPVTAASV